MKIDVQRKDDRFKAINVRRFRWNDDRMNWAEQRSVRNSREEDPKADEECSSNRSNKGDLHTEFTAGGSNDAEIATPTNEPERKVEVRRVESWAPQTCIAAKHWKGYTSPGR